MSTSLRSVEIRLESSYPSSRAIGRGILFLIVAGACAGIFETVRPSGPALPNYLQTSLPTIASVVVFAIVIDLKLLLKVLHFGPQFSAFRLHATSDHLEFNGSERRPVVFPKEEICEIVAGSLGEQHGLFLVSPCQKPRPSMADGDAPPIERIAPAEIGNTIFLPLPEFPKNHVVKAGRRLADRLGCPFFCIEWKGTSIQQTNSYRERKWRR